MRLGASAPKVVLDLWLFPFSIFFFNIFFIFSFFTLPAPSLVFFLFFIFIFLLTSLLRGRMSWQDGLP